MNCPKCRNAMQGHRATNSRPYKYRQSGLSTVNLVGIMVYECERCRLNCPAISRIDELHQVISSVLIAKSGMLTGPEIRFLRKAAGYSALDFSELLRITPEHFSRVENEVHKVSKSVDTLSRVLVSQHQSVREILTNIARELRSMRGSVFSLKKTGWEVNRKAA